MRRSFRMGLWLGLLAGVLVAIFKVVQTRRQGSEPELAEWPPFQPPPASSPEVEPIDAAGPVTVAEPVVEEAPAPAQAPAPAKAPAKKVVKKAAKKVSAKKVAAKKVSAKKAAAKKAVKKAARKAAPGVAWVEPDDGLCPSSHPIKAKLSSRLFHLPGMAFYNRTRADRCYGDEDSAVQDGFTRAKR